MPYTYIEAIALGFPTVYCHAIGDDSVYENLTWDSGTAIPSKTTLDEWIAANPVPVTRHITVLAFRNRFTLHEKTLIELAAVDVSDAQLNERMNSAAVRALLTDTVTASYIDLDRDDTRSGVLAMEAQGLLQAGRALIILDSPISDVERLTYPQP